MFIENLKKHLQDDPSGTGVPLLTTSYYKNVNKERFYIAPQGHKFYQYEVRTCT